MSIATINAGSRFYRVTTATANLAGFPFLELGPAGNTMSVSTLVVQFNPNILFSGSFVVMGRTLGAASAAADTPFVPIPYRRVSLNDLASDYALVSDAITGPAIIQIPANGLSVVLEDGLDAGQMDITIWDLQGSSAV